MPEKIINDRKLLEMIDTEQLTQSEAARRLGITRQAVHRRLKEIRGRTTRVVTLKAAKRVQCNADEKINIVAQLGEINKRAMALLDEAEDDPNLALRAMAEIRSQLKLQLEIFQTLFSLQAAEDFQNTVLETIGSIAPDVRQQIIAELNRKRSIQSALRFS